MHFYEKTNNAYRMTDDMTNLGQPGANVYGNTGEKTSAPAGPEFSPWVNLRTILDATYGTKDTPGKCSNKMKYFEYCQLLKSRVVLVECKLDMYAAF